MKIRIKKLKNFRTALVYFHDTSLNIAEPPLLDLEIEFEDNERNITLIETTMSFNCDTGLWRSCFGVQKDKTKIISGRELKDFEKDYIAEEVDKYFHRKDNMINTMIPHPLVLCKEKEINKEIYNNEDW